MDGEQVPTESSTGGGPEKTTQRAATGLAETTTRRRPIGRCIDWLCGWSFVLSVLLMGFRHPFEENGLPSEIDKDAGDR